LPKRAASAGSMKRLGLRGSLFNIAEPVRCLSVDEALIDGEAVVFRADRKGDFNALLTKARRSTGPRSWPSTFCVEKATIYARGPSGRGEGRPCGWS
jgi:hypothetical protein